jgi:hypothetical protein
MRILLWGANTSLPNFRKKGKKLSFGSAFSSSTQNRLNAEKREGVQQHSIGEVNHSNFLVWLAFFISRCLRSEEAHHYSSCFFSLFWYRRGARDANSSGQVPPPRTI